MTGHHVQPEIAPMPSQVGRISESVGYQLHVAAPDVSTAVTSIGGWIFDQARAGWTVSVLVPDCLDERPLRILGADVIDLDVATAMHDAEPDRFSLAIAADLLNCDNRFGGMLDRRLNDAPTVHAVWGETCPKHMAGELEVVEHFLSSAARVFKEHALRAACAEPTVDPTERLFSRVLPRYANVRHSR